MNVFCPNCGTENGVEGDPSRSTCFKCGTQLGARQQRSNVALWLILGALMLLLGGGAAGYFIGRSSTAAAPAPAAGSAPAGAVDPEALARSREAALKTSCVSNVKQVSLGVLMYAGDWDDVLPREASYTPIAPYLKNPNVYSCPKTSNEYAWNPAAIGISETSIVTPAQFVVLFEGAGQTLDPVHDGTASVGFADGHVKAMAPGSTEMLWKPDEMPK